MRRAWRGVQEGGYDLKKAVVDALVHVMHEKPVTLEAALFHLGEFIEDCEYMRLAARVLHLIGEEAVRAPMPQRFLRYLYNRVILEGSPVRAAAMSALAKFATRIPDARESVVILLRRCVLDDDDEVRDRATQYLCALEAQDGAVEAMVVRALPMSVSQIQRALELYRLRPAPGPLTFEALPHVEVESSTGAYDGHSRSERSRPSPAPAHMRAHDHCSLAQTRRPAALPPVWLPVLPPPRSAPPPLLPPPPLPPARPPRPCWSCPSSATWARCSAPRAPCP